MRSYQKRLLFVVVISLCVVGFFSVSMPDVSFAGGNHGTIGGGPTSYDDGGSSDDDSSGHVKKPKKPHKHWYTSGNKYIDPENYFLGTTDAADLVIRTDNIERVRVTTEGNVGIGTYTPTGTLHVEGGIAEGTTDGTDITLKAQDGGPGGGAGGNIVLAPGTGIMTDEFGNPIPSTDEFGNPILDEFGNPVPVTKNGEVIVKGNIAPAVDDVSSLGTPELRYKNIFMGSNFNYLDDGLFYRYQFWNVRLEPPDWDYINRVVFTWDGKVGIGTDLPTEMLHVEGGGAKISGNVDAASYTGDGSALSGVVTSEADPAFTASAASSITSAGSGVVISAAERTTLGTALQSYTESDPDYNGSAASSITSAGSGVVMSAAERTTLGTALQSYTESDPDYNGSAASGITSAGSGVVISAAERTTLGTALQSYTESDPDYNGSAASSITSAGSGVVISAAERTTLGTALQSYTESDPDYNGSAASGITSAGSGVVMSAAERTTLGTALQSFTESDPDYNGSAASGITSAGSGVVISAAERTTLGTALQSYTESDPDYNGSAASGITSAGSGVVMSAAERTTLGTALQSFTELDPDYNGSAASGITSAGSGVVMSAAERTTLGTALQSFTESDPDYNGSAASGITSAGSGVVMSAAERTTLGTALQSFTESDPDYNGSAASGITSAGSGVVMSAAERTTLGTALQSYTESDPTVTLTKLENLVVDFHTLGGVDQFVDADADSANEIQTIDRTDNEITLSNGGGTVSVADSDNDSANELITGAALVGTDLQLTDAGGTKSVSLSSFVDSGDPSYGSSASSPTNGVFIDNGGNIGISDTTPSYKLDVNGTMSASRFYDRDNTSYYVNPYGTSNLRALNINFDYGARLNLRSAGDTYSNSVYSNFQQLWLTNSNAESIVFLTGTTVGSATGRLTISNAGNVGIPSANAAYKLNVIGTVYASGAAGALSDIRHKKNVQPVSDGMLDIIDNLRPVTYEWKDPSDSGMQGTQIGFIAQEVESVLPEIVLTQEDEDKTKGLKYNEFIPVLVKAMKELKGENDLLKQDVKEVKAENSQLRELISTLTARQDSFEAIVFAKSTNQNERLAKLDEKAINTK